MQLNVQVTKTEINDTLKNHRHQCMVARAIKSQYPTFAYVNVTQEEIRVSDPNSRVRYAYRTPRKVAAFIEAWETGSKILPFRVMLKDPFRWPMAKTVAVRKSSPYITATINPGARSYRKSGFTR